MPNFHYIALDPQGKETTGVVAANSDAEAIGQLRAGGLFPTKVVEEGKGNIKAIKKRGAKGQKTKAKKGKSKAHKGRRVKGKVMMLFTRQLSTLIDSGLPLLRGLSVLAKQEQDPVLKRTLETLADSVQTGSTFSESLAQHPKTFNKLYINMVKAGELGGVLELSLTRLAEYQEKAQKLKSKITAAMVYPMIVMLMAVVIVAFLLVVIVPKFEKIFADMLGPGVELPALTLAVVGFSSWFAGNFIWILLAVVAVVLIHRAVAASKEGRRFLDTLKLRVPVFGNVQRKSGIARFARTLGTLVTSGVPILQALNITKDTAGNVVLSSAIEGVHDAVKEGESMVAPLEASKLFPAMVISMVDVGEETGQLPDMLLKIADVYDDEVDVAVDAMTAMLEPIMIVLLAVIVGTIVMALFLPLVKIIESLSDAA